MDRRSALAGIAATFAASPAGARTKVESLAPADFRTVVAEIDGAEGLATAPNGDLAYSTRSAAVALRRADGETSLLGEPLATGGVAYDATGRILVANVGALHGLPGPLRRINLASGRIETLVSQLEGRDLVTSNCPAAARDGTVYCSHTGWSVGNIGTTSAEGFIYALLPGGEVRIVTRNLRGVNGLCLDAGDHNLYAALTAEGRVVRFRRRADGTLGPARYYGPALGTVVADQKAAEVRALSPADRAATGYCDGLAFDTDGNLWVTLPFANKIVAISPCGELTTVVHDPVGAAVKFPTNLAWGDADLRKLYVVSRDAGSIVAARTEVAGIPAANWPL